MRVFEEPGLSHLQPVTVFVENDEREIPDDLTQLRAYFFHLDDQTDGPQLYREGDAIICFAEEADADRLAGGSLVFSAALLYLILRCQKERITQLIVR